MKEKDAMQAIPDAEKARRYRRKLEDLLKASGEFISVLPHAAFTPATRDAYERLSDERRIIRNQLDIEEDFQKRGENDANL
jgi:DNA-binding GntR family transcriptional regulator